VRLPADDRGVGRARLPAERRHLGGEVVPAGDRVAPALAFDPPIGFDDPHEPLGLGHPGRALVRRQSPQRGGERVTFFPSHVAPPSEVARL
jgi:hypothetical protein